MTRYSLAPAAAGVMALCCALACGSTPNDGSQGSGTEADGSGSDDSESRDEVPETADDSTGSPELPDDDLVGRWRIVAYQTAGAQPFAVTDENDVVNVPGVGTVVGRVNGLMWIRADRVAFASALLFDDHTYPDPAAVDYATALQVQGGAAPGELSDDGFSLTGGTIRYEWARADDGTILQLDAAGGVTTWARIDDAPASDAILAEGQAVVFSPQQSAPLLSPRVALAWDLPDGDAVVTSNDAALDLQPGIATFPLAVTDPPPQAMVPVAGGQLAVAHLIVYDDLDQDRVFTAQGDALRGVSPIGLAYLSPATEPDDLSATRYSELLPGWQYVHFHADYSHSGAVGCAPFDPTIVVSPDVLVDTGPITAPIADVVP